MTALPSYDSLIEARDRGRISYRTYQQWMALWRWAAPHYGGETGHRHDLYYLRYGSDRYWARIKRVRAYMQTLPAPAL